MDTQYTSVEQQIEYGLDSVGVERTVNISLRDLLYVYQTLGELVRFFHNSDHYPDLESIKRFLGDRSQGALGPLFECYYKKLGDVIPEDISEAYDSGTFDNPQAPSYYKPADNDAG